MKWGNARGAKGPNCLECLFQSGRQGRDDKGVGAASKAADLGGGRPLPSIARFGRLAYPIRGEATNRALLGCKRHGRPDIRKDVSGGNDLGGSKLGGLKINE